MKRQNRQERSDGRKQPFFRSWGSIKSVGRIVENEDGVAGVGLEPVLGADREISLGICLLLEYWRRRSWHGLRLQFWRGR